MIKKFLLILSVITLLATECFAEKIAVKISPTQILSTHRDEIETGDIIEFETANDVYFDEKIYIKASTPVYAAVDYVHENGWGGDGAEIIFKKFTTKDTLGNKISTESQVIIRGNDILMKNFISAGRIKQLKILPVFIGHYIRGAEVFVQPDTEVYNIFI